MVELINGEYREINDYKNSLQFYMNLLQKYTMFFLNDKCL